MAFVRKRTTIGSKVAGPKPVVLPSEKKENAGQDPNVSLVPHKRGVWGSLTTGAKPDDQHGGHDVDVPHDGSQSGTLTAHAPSSGGPAWGGAGLPERIQEQAEVAKDSGSNDGSHGGSNTPGRVHTDQRHAHGQLRQWDDYAGRRVHDSHAPPPPPPPHNAGARRSDSEHHPYPPRAPPPPGPPPPGPPPHQAPRGGPHGPADYHPSGPSSGMPPHQRSHPRRDVPDMGKRHPGFSPEGNFTAKLEAMSSRGPAHGPPADVHPPRRGPAEPRSGASHGRQGQAAAHGYAAGQQASTQPSSREEDKSVSADTDAQSTVPPEQARSASATSQDAAAALATAAAAAAAAALQRPPPAAPAPSVPVVSAPLTPAQLQELSGSAPVQATPARAVQIGTPVMHVVQGQPVAPGMQPLPPGVAVLPMMPGVQQKASSHMMVPSMHPATVPVTVHMGPGGMMPVISSHGPPVPGAVYQHMPMARPHLPHQVPAQALMHPQVMLVTHPGGAPLPAGVRPQQAVMGPALPSGPQASMPHPPETQAPITAPAADVRSNAAAAMDHEASAAPAGLPEAHEARSVPAAPGHSGAPAAASMPDQPVMVSQWSRPPNTDAAPGRGRRDDTQQRGPPPAPVDAAAQRQEHISKRRGGRGVEPGRAQAPGRGTGGGAKPGRKPEADDTLSSPPPHRPERSARGRGRRDGVQGQEVGPEPVSHGRAAGQLPEMVAEGEGHDVGRGRGRGRGWGRGAGRGSGRGGRGDAPVEDRARAVSAAQGHAGDGAQTLTDTVLERGAKQAGRGQGRRVSNGRENGREPSSRNGLSRGDRMVSNGVTAPTPEAASRHDTSNTGVVRATGPGRARRAVGSPRSQGRGAGRNGEGSQPRRKDAGDTAVNVESAAAAAQAAAAAATASVEIAPSVFTQALAKVEAMKMPELPQQVKPIESKAKELRRVSKSRKSRARYGAGLDGHSTEVKQ